MQSPIPNIEPSFKLSETCRIILRRFSEGESFRKICEDKETGMPGYAKVRSWLCSDEYAEEFKEFREKFIYIQKQALPLMMEEIREALEELPKHTYTNKDGKTIIEPARWQFFKAKLAAYKWLSRELRKAGLEVPMPLEQTKKSENIPSGTLPPDDSGNWSFTEPFVIVLHCTKQEAEEFLGYPIPVIPKEDPAKATGYFEADHVMFKPAITSSTLKKEYVAINKHTGAISKIDLNAGLSGWYNNKTKRHIPILSG